MKSANYYLLTDFLSVLVTLSVDECREVAQTWPNSDTSVRPVIRKYLVPEFHNLTEESQTKFKDSLAYFLTTGDAPFGDLLENLEECPLPVGDNPIDFFKWLWDELFPAEDYRVSTEGWKVDNQWQASLMRKV